MIFQAMARDKSAKEIAQTHGVTPDTIRRLAIRGIIPADRVGRVYRFDAEEVARVFRVQVSGVGNQ